MPSLIEDYCAAGSLTKLAGKSEYCSLTLWKRLKALNPNYVSIRREYQLNKARTLMLRYILGSSLRKIARAEGMSPWALRRLFIKIHPQYARIAREGSLAAAAVALQRHPKYSKYKRIRNPISDRHCKQIEDWLTQNMDSIFQKEAESIHECLSDKTVVRLSQHETGRRFAYGGDRYEVI